MHDLEGPILGRLVDKVGLAEAAELVALALTEQLESILDEGIGRIEQEQTEERFDASRLAL